MRKLFFVLAACACLGSALPVLAQHITINGSVEAGLNKAKAAITDSLSGQTLDNHSNVAVPSPSVNDVLRWDGTNWSSAPVPGAASASIGIDFFQDDTAIIATGANNAISIHTLSKIPVTTTATERDSVNVTAATSPVIGEAYLYNTALGRTTIDAGVWTFNTYNSVSATNGGRVSSIIRNIFQVIPNAAGATVTTTGTGTSRTATITGGTPFVAADSSVLRQNASYLQTPQGLYQISAYTSTSVVTIITPSGYTNEAGAAYFKWKKLFGVQTEPLLNTSAMVPTINTAVTVQPAYAIGVVDKLGELILGVSNGTTTVRWYHNGSDYYTNMRTPLITLHNNLAGLDGGSTGSYYHAPTLKRFLLPADVDTTVAAQDGNNVEVSTDVFATVHPDSGQVLIFSPEDASATPDTITAVAFDQVFAPGDSLVFYADADTAGQKVAVTITGADGTVILNQTATSADNQGYVRYVYVVAATVTQQEYRIAYKFIGYLSHWMKVSRVTMKKAG